MSRNNKGIKMGTDIVMDKGIYSDETKANYDRDIDPNNDDMDLDEQIDTTKLCIHIYIHISSSHIILIDIHINTGNLWRINQKTIQMNIKF